MVNHTPLLSRRTGAGHEVDRNIRLVPGFRFVEKLHACRLPWIRQLKIRDENDETFMIADFPGHRSCLIGVIGQNVCPFWLVFLCGSGRFSCSSCMGGELEVGQNVCPEWPVRPCGTTVE